MLVGTVEYANASLQRGKMSPSLNEATCWLWVVTHNAWGQDPGSWAFHDPAAKAVTWPPTFNFDPYWQSERPDPINRLVMSSPSTYIIVQILFFKFSCGKQTHCLFCLKGARRWWLSVNFYMSTLENKFFFYTINKPNFYLSYADNILLLTNSTYEINTIQETFQNNSVLNFTQININNKIPFLGVLIDPRGVEFQVCSINKSAHMKKVWRLIGCTT